MLSLLLLAAAMPGLIQLVVYVFVFVVVVWLVYYLVNTFLPEPMKKFANAIIIVVAVIFLLYFVLSIFGGGGGLRV